MRCCGSTCDLPWAESMGSSARNDRFDHMADVIPESEQAELLVLAPAFFKVGGTYYCIGCVGLAFTTSPVSRINRCSASNCVHDPMFVAFIPRRLLCFVFNRRVSWQGGEGGHSLLCNAQTRSLSGNMAY